MRSTTILIGLAALAAGFGAGYFAAGDTTPAAQTHVMPDGSVMSNTMADMTAGLDGKTGDDFDRAFIEEMIVHHEGAVAMAEQALLSAKHAEIKTMAQEIVSAQTREIDTMRSWLRSWFGVQ